MTDLSTFFRRDGDGETPVPGPQNGPSKALVPVRALDGSASPAAEACKEAGQRWLRPVVGGGLALIAAVTVWHPRWLTGAVAGVSITVLAVLVIGAAIKAIRASAGEETGSEKEEGPQ